MKVWDPSPEALLSVNSLILREQESYWQNDGATAKYSMKLPNGPIIIKVIIKKVTKTRRRLWQLKRLRGETPDQS